MPVRERSPQKKKREPRRFPPSLAGSCLRYAVMEVLGFGRLIDPESMTAMHEGSRLHKLFQQQLMSDYAMAAVEVPLKDEGRRISGRMDAVVETERGPWVIEYKTVSQERFDAVLDTGPLVSHWAQLQLYLTAGTAMQGSLVVDCRESGRRMIFHAVPDSAWKEWIQNRISQVQSFQKIRRLPSREVSVGCLSCDRWQRCFPTEIEREAAVAAHPRWEPEPELPTELIHDVAQNIV